MTKISESTQKFLNQIHNKFEDLKNIPQSSHQKKYDLLQESLTKMRTIYIYYGNNANDVILAYFDGLCYFKDYDFIINNKRHIPQIAKNWSSLILKYLISANHCELVYFNSILDFIAEKSSCDFSINYKRPIDLSYERKSKIQNLGCLCYLSMKQRINSTMSENRYSVELAEDFVSTIGEEKINKLKEQYGSILLLTTKESTHNEKVVNLINEQQKTLFDF